MLILFVTLLLLAVINYQPSKGFGQVSVILKTRRKVCGTGNQTDNYRGKRRDEPATTAEVASPLIARTLNRY